MKALLSSFKHHGHSKRHASHDSPLSSTTGLEATTPASSSAVSAPPDLSELLRQAKLTRLVIHTHFLSSGLAPDANVKFLLSALLDTETILLQWTCLEHDVFGHPAPLSELTSKHIKACSTILTSLRQSFNTEGVPVIIKRLEDLLNKIRLGVHPSAWSTRLQWRAGLMTSGNLAWERYLETQNLTDLSDGIRYLEILANDAPRASRDRRQCFDGLSVAFEARFDRLKDPRDINDAVRVITEAVISTPFEGDDCQLWVRRRRRLREVLETKRANPPALTAPGRGGDSDYQQAQSLYKDLQPGYIRLLKLTDEDPLTCDLGQYPLDKAPPYTALSYTWVTDDDLGRPNNNSYSVIVNGKPVQIQQNLYDALTHTTEMIKAYGEFFWADFLCINQDDILERSQQVQRMTRIYSNAKLVLAWLGLPFIPLEIELALSLMKHWIGDWDGSLRDHGWNTFQDIQNGIAEDPTGFPHEGNPKTFAAWEGIAYLFSRPYWQRTWVFQEMTTPVPLALFCGSYQISDWHLLAANIQAKRYQQIPGFEPYFHAIVNRLSIASLHIDMRLIRGSPNPDPPNAFSLLNVLYTLRSTKCKDARDKVFAARGLAEDAAASLIAVDYDRELIDVYVDVVRYAIAKGYGLWILGFVVSPSDNIAFTPKPQISNPRLPSWVPDWRYKFVNLEPFGAHSRLGREPLPLYSPWPHTRPDMHIVGHTLSLRTMIIDSLFAAADAWRPWDLDNLAGRKVDRDYLRSQGGKFTDESFNRTLLGDIISEKRGAAADWPLLESTVEDLDAADREKRHDMFSQILHICAGRRLGLTKNGRVGVFPAGSQVNDIVAAFRGGRILYLIRPAQAQGKYVFIGECYVDGIMDGEVILGADHEHRSEKSITLV